MNRIVYVVLLLLVIGQVSDIVGDLSRSDELSQKIDETIKDAITEATVDIHNRLSELDLADQVKHQHVIDGKPWPPLKNETSKVPQRVIE